jgi:hypothetical protein
MKHFGLGPVTLVTLTLTGVLLPYSGWFASRGSARPPARPEAHLQTRELSADAALRYRSAQPNHWRALVLHR